MMAAQFLKREIWQFCNEPGANIGPAAFLHLVLNDGTSIHAGQGCQHSLGVIYP